MSKCMHVYICRIKTHYLFSAEQQEGTNIDKEQVINVLIFQAKTTLQKEIAKEEAHKISYMQAGSSKSMYTFSHGENLIIIVHISSLLRYCYRLPSRKVTGLGEVLTYVVMFILYTANFFINIYYFTM